MFTPREARSLCHRAHVDSAVSAIMDSGMNAGTLMQLLNQRVESDWGAWSGTVELSDEYGRRTEMAVHVPPPSQNMQLGALIVLHGAGGRGDEVLPYFSAFGNHLGMAVICPTAQFPPQVSNNLDLAGIFGKRFSQPSWDMRGHDFPMAALRWARTELDVDPNRCAIVGTSMGGLATWSLALRFWHFFSAAVPINGALSMWESFGTDRRTRSLLPNVLPLSMFVVHGSRDEQISPQFDRESVAELRNLGHDALKYIEVEEGRHRFTTLKMDEGSQLFDHLVRWLGRRRRRCQPMAIQHRAIDDAHGRAHWVRISGIKPHQTATVRARRLAPERINIDVTGAEEVTLYLRREWAVPGGTVYVSINGSVSTVRFEPQIRTVVETFQDTADSELTAEQVVSFRVNAS